MVISVIGRCVLGVVEVAPIDERRGGAIGKKGAARPALLGICELEEAVCHEEGMPEVAK